MNDDTVTEDRMQQSDSPACAVSELALRSGSIVAYEVYPRRDYC